MSIPTAGYRFNAPPVANSNNRVNSSRQAPGNTKGRASYNFTNIIQAGQTMPVIADGTQFYFRTATAQLQVKPSGGVFSPYAQGEGLNLDLENAFSQLEIKNTNSFAVVFEVFIGFQGFIDNKLILSNALYPNVVFPTYPTASVAAVIDITDKSGTAFTDINGGNWYALQRQSILYCNTDSGVVYLIQKANTAIGSGPAIAAVQPLTSVRLDVSGNYRVATGGGNINSIVSEVYSVIPAIT